MSETRSDGTPESVIVQYAAGDVVRYFKGGAQTVQDNVELKAALTRCNTVILEERIANRQVCHARDDANLKLQRTTAQLEASAAANARLDANNTQLHRDILAKDQRIKLLEAAVQDRNAKLDELTHGMSFGAFSASQFWGSFVDCNKPKTDERDTAIEAGNKRIKYLETQVEGLEVGINGHRQTIAAMVSAEQKRQAAPTGVAVFECKKVVLRASPSIQFEHVFAPTGHVTLYF
jgi:hypothetical protein